MVDNKDNQEDDPKGAPVPEKNIPAVEQVPAQRVESVQERRELSRDDKIISAELRKEIEMMELDDATKAEAEKKAEKIEFLGEKEKIKHLLQMAREKGVYFAIQVAKKMNEPYLLDTFHDLLSKEGYYKNFIKE